MLVWINGTIRQPDEAHVSIFDRGFLYGDAVYELVRFFDGVGIGMDLHVERLARSLELTRIAGFDPEEYGSICDALLEALGDDNATVYLQVTRGKQVPRSHAPEVDPKPTVVAIATRAEPLSALTDVIATEVALVPDERRLNCQIKATSLLENVLATMKANDVGASEPILHLDGLLTEGGSSNIFVVQSGTLRTPALDAPRPILAGVMRTLCIEAAEAAGVSVLEGDTPAKALQEADEAFITSSRRLLAPIRAVDGMPTPSVCPGPVTLRIHEQMRRILEEQVARAGSSSVPPT